MYSGVCHSILCTPAVPAQMSPSSLPPGFSLKSGGMTSSELSPVHLMKSPSSQCPLHTDRECTLVQEGHGMLTPDAMVIADQITIVPGAVLVTLIAVRDIGVWWPRSGVVCCYGRT